MKKVEKKNYEEIDGGGILASMAAISTIAQTVVTTGKMLFSDSGSIKTKEGLNFSWEDKDNGVNILLPKMYDA